MAEQQLYTELKINGQAVSGVNSLGQIHGLAGLSCVFPTLEIHLSDFTAKFTGSNALVEGTALELLLGRDAESANVFKFAVVKASYDDGTAGNIRIYARYDAPKYTLEASRESVRGTSVAAIREILSRCGLELESSLSTNDDMTWLNIGKVRSAFIRSIADRGYINKESCTRFALFYDGVGYYEDINALMRKEPDVEICMNTKAAKGIKAFHAMEVQSRSISGLVNRNQYGNEQVRPSIKEREPELLNSIQPPVSGAGLQVNDKTNKDIVASRIDYAYYDTGTGIPGSNFHDFYQEAKYQNDRYSDLFSEIVRVRIPAVTGIKPFQVVYLNHGRAGDVGNTAEKTSGKYIVGNVGFMVKGRQYFEYVDLYRNYTGESGTTPVIAGSAGSSEIKPDSANSVPKSTASTAVLESKTKPAQQKVESLSDKADAYKKQLNPQIESDPLGASTIDKYQKDAMGKIDALEKEMMEQAGVFNFKELQDKYGRNVNAVDSLMREVSSALNNINVCNPLSNLEKLSLNIASTSLSALFNHIMSKLNKTNGLMDFLMNGLNRILDGIGLSSGAPNARSNCKAVSDQFKKLIGDSSSQSCLDMATLEKLNMPGLRLDKLARLANKQLRDLLCLMGEDK